MVGLAMVFGLMRSCKDGLEGTEPEEPKDVERSFLAGRKRVRHGDNDYAIVCNEPVSNPPTGGMDEIYRS